MFSFLILHRRHQLKHKFKSIIYNISGYEANFLIVLKQIYNQSFEIYWSGAGAGAKDAGAELELESFIFKMPEQRWSWSHRFFASSTALKYGAESYALETWTLKAKEKISFSALKTGYREDYYGYNGCNRL